MTSPSFNPTSSATLAVQVMNHVRDSIQSGTMTPDNWYSAYQLADQLGISRSPVREGLLRLEEAGIIEFVKNRGFRVIQPQPSDVADIFGIRLALEPAAAARAARLRTADALAELHHIVDSMRAAMAAGDEPGFFEWDLRLHDAILNAGNARRARDILARLRTHTRLLSDSTVRNLRSLQQVFDEHLPIVTAIEAGDSAAAHQAMEAHITATGHLLLTLNVHKTRPTVAMDSPEIIQEVQALWDGHVAQN